MKPVIAAHFHPFINKWSVLVVDMSEGGTHKRYNVLYNSECDMKYFDTEEEAKKAGREHEGNRS